MKEEFKVGDLVRGKKCGTQGVLTYIDEQKPSYLMEVRIGSFQESCTVFHYEIEYDTADLRIGDRIKKVSGYKYPGVVVSVFRNLKGEDRYVVECSVPEVAGMLHIYNRNQLEKVGE
jgi:hypothetical protein